MKRILVCVALLVALSDLISIQTFASLSGKYRNNNDDVIAPNRALSLFFNNKIGTWSMVITKNDKTTVTCSGDLNDGDKDLRDDNLYRPSKNGDWVFYPNGLLYYVFGYVLNSLDSFIDSALLSLGLKPDDVTQIVLTFQYKADVGHTYNVQHTLKPAKGGSRISKFLDYEIVKTTTNKLD